MILGGALGCACLTMAYMEAAGWEKANDWRRVVLWLVSAVALSAFVLFGAVFVQDVFGPWVERWAGR